MKTEDLVVVAVLGITVYMVLKAGFAKKPAAPPATPPPAGFAPPILQSIAVTQPVASVFDFADPEFESDLSQLAFSP